MSRLPPGTVLQAVSNDHADEPMDYEIPAGDLVLIMRQNGDEHYGDTTMLSLATGVLYRVEYTSDCRYEAMDDTYEVFEP